MINMLKEQLINVSGNEPLLLQRIDEVRQEMKNQIGQRNQLKEHMYEQFKEAKKREYYGRSPRGQGLSNIQAEILETLFHSNEQVIQNNTMKMKEQRLNIKMAKKEYMIGCMAEQVGLREYVEPASLYDGGRNFLST